MTARPAWLSFGSSAQPSASLLVEFHQPLHFVLLDGESGLPTVRVLPDPDGGERPAELSPEELAYIEKLRRLVADKQASGKFERPADYQPPPVGTMPSGRVCDLCQLAHYTPWYAEFHRPLKFTILDCDACEVPIAVLAEHRVELTPDEVSFMEQALNLVAEQKYTGQFPKWTFDHTMRQIPDHYHFHVRPLLW